jgi:DNA-binding LacI/PurR family transcriptional regulator
MPTPRPTLRRLAAEAGVSPMTVSLALRNSRQVSTETRAWLKRLAALRGYRPDPTITKLMQHLRTRAPRRFQASLCALMQSWGRVPQDANGYYERLERGLRGRAESLGFAFDTVDLNQYPTRRSLQRVLLSRGVEGIVLLPLLRPGRLDDRLDWEAFSTVAVTSSVLAPHFHNVVPHHFDNMLRVCEELARAGLARIGLAISKDHDVRVNHRWLGAMAWHNSLAGTQAVVPLLGERAGPWLDPAVFADWLRRERPDAVIVDPLDRAMLATALARLPARRRPQVVTMNWPSPGAHAGIDQRAEEIGAAAIEVVAGMMARGDKGIPQRSNTTMITGDWAAGRLSRGQTLAAR